MGASVQQEDSRRVLGARRRVRAELTLVRTRRTTANLRPADGRELLARALSQLNEIQTEYQQYCQRLQTQYEALNRVCHNDRTPFLERMHARQMAYATHNYLTAGAPLAAVLERLLLGARQRLDSLREIDGVTARHVASGPLVEQAQLEVSTLRQSLNQYLWDSMAANNQAFLDDHRDLAAANGANQPLGGPDFGSAFHAWASTQGLPEGITSYRAAYRASWDTQARLFQYGRPVADNLHLRRFTFADASCVEIQAHQPLSLYSEDRQAVHRVLALVGLAVLAGLFAVVGGTAGVVVRSALGAAVGGIVSALVVQSGRPRDVAWQGYTARFYASADDVSAPWGTQYFYGLKRSPWVRSPVSVGGRFDSAQCVNFADQPDAFSWRTWHSGAADVRAPERLPVSLSERQEPLASAQVLAQINTLIQSMAQLGAPLQSQETRPLLDQGVDAGVWLAAIR